ncbi:hypothetical protein [Methylomusa anaerophila]|nr:hypothetical protein [Methylomusa anaerophila]
MRFYVPENFRLTKKGRDHMNIFENRSNFIGTFEPERTKNSVQNLFKLAKEIREKLSKQGYLLDSYLSYVLEAANNTLLYEAAEKGFEAGSELQNLCYAVMDGSGALEEHPFYQTVKQSFDLQQDTYQERTTIMSLHSVLLADAFMEYATQSYVREQEAMLNILDDVKLCELYKKIIFLVDENLMEQLNLALKERFFIVPVVAGFMQGLTNDLLYSLTYRDSETSRQIFQLIMDAMSIE